MSIFQRSRGDTTPASTGHGRILAAGLIASVVIVLLLALSIFLSQRVREASFARTDSDSWNVIQTEVAYQRFALALGEAVSASYADGRVPEDIHAKVTRMFDLYYARLDTVSARVKALGFSDAVADNLDQLYRSRDAWVEIIDGGAPSTHDEAMALYDQVLSEAERVRSFAVAALHASNTIKEADRAELHSSLQIYLIVSLALIFLATLVALTMMIMGRQIDTRARQQEQISSYLTNMVEAAQDAIFVLDTNLNIIEFNSAAEEMFGADRSQALGAPVIETYTPTRWRAVFRRRLNALFEAEANAAHDFRRAPVRAQRADGRAFAGELTVVRERGLDGEPILICFLRDTSQETEARNRARRALGRARSDAAAKSRFLATMSHDMRTPLHGVIAALDMADAESADPETANYLRLARDAADTALQQIEDVLDITKHDHTMERELPETYQPRKVIAGICSQLDPLAATRGNRIDTTWRGPEEAFGLRRAFSKTLYNLVSNAIKFTRDGRIAIAGEARDIEGVPSLVVSVTDTGRGIAPRDLDHIFEDFYSDPDRDIDDLPGTGLGLGIAERATMAMGGRLEVSSELGIGSCFTLTIPAQFEADEDAQPPAPNRAAPSWHPEPGKRALVIEDHPTNRDLIRAMVEKMGYRVDTAADGLEGVARAYETRFDLILTDMSMPNLSGLDAAACIRTIGQSREACIVAVTAHATMVPEETIKVFEHGIDGIVAKPFTREKLRKQLSEIFEEKEEMRDEAEALESGEVTGGDDPLADLPAADVARLKSSAADDLETVDMVLTEALSGGGLVTPDWEDIARKAHYAAGAFFFLGEKAQGDVLIQTEVAAKAHDLSRLRGLSVLLSASLRDMRAQEDLVGPAQ